VRPASTVRPSKGLFGVGAQRAISSSRITRANRSVSSGTTARSARPGLSELPRLDDLGDADELRERLELVARKCTAYCAGVTFRTRLLARSAMKTLPARSRAKEMGKPRSAPAAGPPSPE
jgi:hypothetical protein